MKKELDIIKTLKEKMYQLFSDENSGHDISHLERVYNNAIKIQSVEGGDYYVVAVSSLVHDIHRLMSNEVGYFVYPEESLDRVKSLLLMCNVDKTKLEQILEVVKNHDNKDNKNFSLETLIVQDADALDAMGKIGLERSLKYNKAHNIPITNPTVPLNSKEYIPDVNPISACHYIYNTMIPNAKKLYTKTAKELAKDKIAILEDFIKAHYMGQDL